MTKFAVKAKYKIDSKPKQGHLPGVFEKELWTQFPMFQFMLPTKGQSAIWRLTDVSFILIFNVEKKLRASQIYHRHSGFSTQLRYRFIRRPQSKETSPDDISSEVPKSSVTKLKGPQNAPFSVSTATNSTQHRLLWTTTCYFCVPCFHYRTLLFPAAQFPYTLKYLTQLPTVYICKNQMSCVQSVQLSTLIFYRLRSCICTEAGSPNSKGHMTHSIIMGKNSIKSALGILQSPFQLSDYIQYRIEKKIVRPDLHVPAS